MPGLPCSTFLTCARDSNQLALPVKHSPTFFCFLPRVKDTFHKKTVSAMSRTPSPTSSQSPKTSATAVNTSAVSVPKVPEVSDVPIRVSRPSIAFAGTAAGASTDGRRSSIQFAPALDLSTSRPNVPSLKLQRRMSSPPPPRLVRSLYCSKPACCLALVSQHHAYFLLSRSYIVINTMEIDSAK